MERARPATPGDLTECATLLDRARAEVSGRRGGDLLLAGDQATVEEWLAQGPRGRRVLVGEYAGAVVGLASGHVDRDGLGVVDCCYVEPEARGVGVGGELMAALLRWFSESGCTGVDALALPGDRSTKQLYEAAGFTARLLVLHRPLR